MKQSKQGDHLGSSLTDLMTSLMVIFVLLLVSRLNNQAGQRAVAADQLQARLKEFIQETSSKIQDARTLDQSSTSADKVRVGRDTDDPNTLVIDIPNSLLNFDSQDATLKPSGHDFLVNHIPEWAAVLCGPDVRNQVDTVVVEGHSDQTHWQNSTFEESKEKNLTLSQQRSMAVVSDSLQILREKPVFRDCFLGKISATGRGEEDPADWLNPASEKNRRVVFKIRLKPDVQRDVAEPVRSPLQK